nr:glycoside hydrolase family 88 protein [Streptomyces sp. 8L]
MGRRRARQDPEGAAGGAVRHRRVHRHAHPAGGRRRAGAALRRVLERQPRRPAALPGPETSGTVFFAYGTAYAVASGLVDRATYLPVAARAWNGLVATAVHPDGVLGYVQKVGDRPDSSQPVTYDSTADFGVGGFLLAGAELAGLAT